MTSFSGRLLAIDDELAFGRLVKRAAESVGYASETTDDPRAFTNLARVYRPDVIFLDLKIPDIDGIQLLRSLAADKCTAQIVLVSGSDGKVLDTAMQLGRERGLKMHSVLPKPVRLDTLRALLDELRPAPKLHVADELAEAIETGALFLEYQPKLDCRKCQLTGAEALVRWQHPRRGLVRPDAFIPAAEESGLICRVTDWVVAAAARQAARWAAAGLPLEMAVNISARDLSNLDLPDRLTQHSRDAGIDPAAMTLELTETGAMREALDMMDVLTRLRIAGFNLSIDDFGTGYSSLVQLQKMPFSEVKVDRAFVMRMTTHKDCRVIVETIIELARRLGLKSVAEGVEDAAALDALMASGCDLAQGYHLSRPLAADLIPDTIQAYAAPERRVALAERIAAAQ